MIQRTSMLFIGSLLLTACSGPADTPDETASHEDAASTPPAETQDVTAASAGEPAKEEEPATSGPAGFPADAPLSDRVEYYVTTLSAQLPQAINNSTIMDRASRNGLEIELHYTMIDPGVTANALQRWAADNAPPNTCDNALTAQMVRDGASFRYTYSGGNLGRDVSVLVDRC
ncbi:hypothetical protein V0U79_10345 [Hyphobacterium sp. HN65]|uniref:SCP domain-containing protein n=1 Tax=Hyphobacterium lacteum TaxID=3116575 RepID=A0ABU7LSB8_9PROT|nr:hypothetical protein [Hyphobacterium sp. HN65]MEE2526770.1 hypothetical protein [Hyphobacterium sp. HN65]